MSNTLTLGRSGVVEQDDRICWRELPPSVYSVAWSGGLSDVNNQVKLWLSIVDLIQNSVEWDRE